MGKTAFSLLFLVYFPLICQCQDSPKQRKNLRVSALGGPGFTPDAGFLIGASLLTTFSLDRRDTSLNRSVVPIAVAYFINGGGTINIRPQLFFKNDTKRMFGEFSLVQNINHYHGVGFNQNSDVERGSNTTQYDNIGFKINPVLLFRIRSSNYFIGPQVDVNERNMDQPSQGVIEDSIFIEQGGTKDGLRYFNSGLGVRLNYDTRDVPANSYRGMLIELNATFYDKALGSDSDFGVYSIIYKQFKELKKIGTRKVLAWMARGRFTSGDVPITELSKVGSQDDLRGYFNGQYRDRNALLAIAEYRHMFNMGDETRMRRLGSKLGFAAWLGIGTITSDLTDWSNTGVLPNFGAGLRIELQPRMNFRVDVGHDPINQQTLVYLGVTEAF